MAKYVERPTLLRKTFTSALLSREGSFKKNSSCTILHQEIYEEIAQRTKKYGNTINKYQYREQENARTNPANWR